MTDTTGAAEQAADLGLGDVHHVGFVVADRDKAIDDLERVLGRRAGMRVVGPSGDTEFRGVVAGYELAVGWIPLGGALLEFLQPLDDRSPHAEFLREHGGGLHHLGFRTSAFDQELARLTAMGLSTLIDATQPSQMMRMVYLEGAPAHGLLVEIMERSPAADAFWEHVAGAGA